MNKFIKYSKNLLALIGLGTCLFLGFMTAIDIRNDHYKDRTERSLASVNEHAHDLATRAHIGLVQSGYKLNPDICMEIVKLQDQGEL